MGMVVRTNTMAQNAYRQLGMNNSSVGKSLEKLSSGFRINRAADDASGLAISEKMKAQIKGLEQASANSQDGISLIQTAEGATTEIHNMLNRMTELATKSANGTIQNDVDRDAIQREVDDLNSEISRIANSTDFNGIKLLNGELGGTVGASASKILDIKGFGQSGGTAFVLDATKAAGVKNTADVTTAALGNDVDAGAKITVTIENAKTGEKKDIVLTLDEDLASAGSTKEGVAGKFASLINNDKELSSLFTAGVNAAGKMTITSKNLDQGWAVKKTASDNTDLNTAIAGGDVTMAGEDAPEVTLTKNGGGAFVAGDTLEINGRKYEIVGAKGDKATTTGYKAVTATDLKDRLAADLGVKVSDSGSGVLTFELKDPTAANDGLKLQVGATNDTFNHVSVVIEDLTATGIGTVGLDVSTQDAAGDSISIIKEAINKVSTNRANLGSLQNRLEYTINNLDTTAENMTAANSRIRDTDMAKEMMNYTKMNILTQSAQAMLAQANQQPQAILQLLQ